VDCTSLPTYFASSCPGVRPGDIFCRDYTAAKGYLGQAEGPGSTPCFSGGCALASYFGPGVPRLSEIGEHYHKQLELYEQFLDALQAIQIPGCSGPRIPQDGPPYVRYVGVNYTFERGFEPVEVQKGSWIYLTRLSLRFDKDAPTFSTIRLGDDGKVLDLEHRELGLHLINDAAKVFGQLATGLWSKPSGK
jgi:hypothetical protein